MKGRRKDGWLGPLLFTAGLFSAAEAGLRLAGFQYSNYPLSMRYVASIAHIGTDQTPYEKSFHIDYVLDPLLLWRPVPNPGITNRQAFIGPEWNLEKRKGTARVISLGDSCTVSGRAPYPQRLGLMLDRLDPGHHWEVLNAGVGSWSSYQGLKLLESQLLMYRPDFVTIYFGWNDHWLAWTAPDRELSAQIRRQWRVENWIRKSRLLEALDWLATKAVGGPRFTAKTPFRVSIGDYKNNLERMAASIRSAGGTPVFITAPTDLTPSHPVILQMTRETHNFFDPNEINRVHDAYNEQVRKVAAETRAPLVDAAREFGADPRWFRDGIHLTADGHRKLAELLARAIAREQSRLNAGH